MFVVDQFQISDMKYAMQKIYKPSVGLRCACPTLLLLLLVGCGSQGPERATISGTVTYMGEPLKTGVIRLVPMPGTTAPVSTAPITDGRYTLSAHGGVPVGTHKIEIMANRPNKQAPVEVEDFPGLASKANVEQYIPEKYNKKSELTITVPSGSGAITKDFDLTE